MAVDPYGRAALGPVNWAQVEAESDWRHAAEVRRFREQARVDAARAIEELLESPGYKAACAAEREGWAMDEGAEREMTYGERAVGLRFNPSGDPRVTEVKELYARVIDLLKAGMEGVPGGEHSRLYEYSIRSAQTAQMWAVKSVTWVEADDAGTEEA